MPEPVRVVAFDVNETLSDLAPMAERFTGVGAPAHLAKEWFAAVLRDGFALTAAGGKDRFSTIAEGALRTVLFAVGDLPGGIDAAVEHILAGFSELPPHADVPAGVRALRAGGRRLITLTNGSAATAHGLLERAGVLQDFEALLSVDDAPAWKPARSAYEYAATRCSVSPGELLLVAVHPWDVDGASRAGLRTAWVNRTRAPYPAYFRAPDLTVRALTDLAEVLAASG